MREIKFRAWIESRSCFADSVEVFGDGSWSYELECEGYSIGSMSEDSDILMQYTGLSDKNGVEIYEGDIVKTKLITGDECVGTIGYADKWAQFFLAVTNLQGCGIALDSVHQWHYDPDGVVLSEVIGNIYENPELLEK